MKNSRQTIYDKENAEVLVCHVGSVTWQVFFFSFPLIPLPFPPSQDIRSFHLEKSLGPALKRNSSLLLIIILKIAVSSQCVWQQCSTFMVIQTHLYSWFCINNTLFCTQHNLKNLKRVNQCHQNFLCADDHAYKQIFSHNTAETHPHLKFQEVWIMFDVLWLGKSFGKQQYDK